ncbi:MAG: glucuronyl hydrolase [Paludibacter sp.]|nr:glucuronyl hydrolase [Paludibacter sp.]
MKVLIKKALDVASIQSINMCKSLKDSTLLLPRTIDKQGKLMTSDSRWWCSGFFPGVLWYLYENSGDKEMKEQAELYTKRVEREKFTKTNHDVGFMIYCSFGNGYRLTHNKAYKKVIETGCYSLSTRYNDRIKSIRSWDYNKKWQFPVIIDNMMNLEMLLWGAKTFKNDRFKEIAINHANTTLEHHFRPDYSCYHLVSYDSISGKPHIKQTHQGASDSSAWARGQGWALYGYTFMYRETKNPAYLELARHIATYILNHPRLPEDKIPYWDFDAPNIPNEERDASAGALIASALLELSGYVNATERKQYISVAETQLRTLCSDEYLAKPGTNGNFILKHSVGSKPHKDKAPYFGEVDVPLTYADYYFMEALVRYQNLLKK